MSDIIRKNAADTWYLAHQLHLTKMALMLGYQPVEANDLVNQFFLELLEKNIDPETVSNPQAYLSTAFRRKLIDHYRRSKSRMYVVSDDLQGCYRDSEPSAQDIMEQAQNNAELVSRLRKAYSHLPERCKKVLYLKFYRNLSTEEIARETGLTKRSVYNNLFEGIKLLRAELGNASPDGRYTTLFFLLPLLFVDFHW